MRLFQGTKMNFQKILTGTYTGQTNGIQKFKQSIAQWSSRSSFGDRRVANHSIIHNHPNTYTLNKNKTNPIELLFSFDKPYPSLQVVPSRHEHLSNHLLHVLVEFGIFEPGNDKTWRISRLE